MFLSPDACPNSGDSYSGTSFYVMVLPAANKAKPLELYFYNPSKTKDVVVTVQVIVKIVRVNTIVP